MYKKNILLAGEQYIFHQCNCVTNHSKGLCKIIFDTYPYANTYKTRTVASIPGTISIHEGERGIINGYAQYYPGKAVDGIDNKNNRLFWFDECLKAVCSIEGIKSIAMSENIGCGLAKGNKEEYKKIIDKYSSKIRIVLY